MPIIKEEPLSKYDPSTFAFATCKSEVAGAMQEDWKYNKVDDAKKRAIYDSHNYDEFKARVATCTLKPIHRNEFNAPPKYVFNRAGAKESEQKTGSSVRHAGLDGQVGLMQPGKAAIKTGREFDRELRRCSSAQDKVALLQRLEEGDFARLFGRELDAEVLRRLILALDETLGSADAPFGSAQRFFSALATHCPSSAATAASFLINEERAAVARLLARESRCMGVEPAENARICAALGVPPQMVETALAQVEEEAPALPGEGPGMERTSVRDGPAASPAGAAGESAAMVEAAAPPGNATREAAAKPSARADDGQIGACSDARSEGMEAAEAAAADGKSFAQASAVSSIGFGGCDTLD
mmetsp:Transcript_104676/g.305594  ORF Transcript_104676/g.305594 Transcript_104676/m.305594 type:complete len:357 (-) Transcript_104676:36-1106(-)